ncbi:MULTISPECIES: helix-turn-helix transcriptional regulator [Aeromonas]|uniref:helix-turn-helix transcriptional regulator n=1 Tax=Aeromonas TaxID=642 RepID=UPI00290DB406|nr:AraC family transcriptional regulator [Aeromonas sp.]MDU7582797.1 AraC family transcriptional regulator [Aeromonas sp.]
MEHYTTEAWIHNLVTQAIEHGLDASSINKLIGLRPTALTSSLVKVPMEKAYLLFGLLHESNFQTKNELDFIITSTLPMLNSNIHGAYFNNSPDVRTFITRFTRMFELQTTSIRFEVEVSTTTTRIYIDFIDNKADFYVPQALLMFFSLLSNNIFSFEEEIRQQIIIGVTQSMIPDYETFCLYITDRILTKKPRAFIQLPTAVLAYKNPHHNPLLCHFISSEYDKIYGITDEKDKLVTHIISHISGQWGSGSESVNIAQVAKNIGMSRSKLYRELTLRNINFSEIVESERKKFALEQIKNREMTITEISDRLGYANVSAFTRAFNRWFNINPSRMRQQ